MPDKKSNNPTHIGDLVPDSENARLHNERNLSQIVQALNEVGAARSIVIDEDNNILAGNGVTEAAAIAGIENVKVVDADGETIIAVRRTGLTPEQKKRLALFDNRAAELATWDIDQLKIEFDNGLLEGMFSKSELERLRVLSPSTTANNEPENADLMQEKWSVQLGDVWKLGRHMILCGDCTDSANIDRLLGADRAVMCFTDPPYNVDYGGSESNNKDLGYRSRNIKNDNLGDKFRPFMLKVCANIYDYLVPGGILYMCMSAQEWPVVDDILRHGQHIDGKDDHAFHWSSTIIWAKDRLVITRKDYHTRYEPLWYGWRGDAPRIRKVANRKEDDVWDIERPASSDDHPTMKPVELVKRAILNSSLPNDLIIDFFSGSGTTLVTCEETDRVCRAIELDPRYVSVTCERWMKQTGLTPERIPAA